MSAEQGNMRGELPQDAHGEQAPQRRKVVGADADKQGVRVTKLYTKDVLEQPIRRPRAAIQTELTATQTAMDTYDERLNSMVSDFSPEQYKLLDPIFDAMHEGEPIDELVTTLSPDMQQRFASVRPLAEKFMALERKEEALKKESLPYVKADVEQTARKLLARIDYDKVFGYYGELEKKTDGKRDSTDFLERTIGNLHLARKSGYEATLSSAAADKGYDYFTDVQQTLEENETTWDARGFLKASADEVDEISVFDKDETMEARCEALGQEIDTAEKTLREYGHLIYTYRQNLARKRIREHDDWGLTHLRIALDTSSWNDHYQEHLDDIGLDPRMIDAAERHVAAKILDHRRAGRLPKTDEILAEERQRLDAIDLDRAYDHIAFHGFEPPEGMEAVFDKERFIKQAKKTIPADFVVGLDSIAVLPEKEAVDGEITRGALITEYGTGEEWDTVISQELEVYKQVFVDDTAPELEKRMIATSFWETVDHELGHNGHELADYDEMKGWEEVQKMDQTAITWYVQDSRNESEDKGKREDFADSAEMLKKDPFLLYLLSEPRYHFMNSYFKRHMPSQQVPFFELEQRFNIQTSYDSFVSLYGLTTLDEIRAKAKELYLTHENESSED